MNNPKGHKYPHTHKHKYFHEIQMGKFYCCTLPDLEKLVEQKFKINVDSNICWQLVGYVF